MPCTCSPASVAIPIHLRIMLFQGKTNEYLLVESIDASNCRLLEEQVDSGLTLLWFTGSENEFIIDNRRFTFRKNQILALTEFHKIEVLKISTARMVRFNRSFYCILDHDSEVSCKGVLFFGASQVPVIDLPEGEAEKFEILWKMFTIEMAAHDHLQLEMLQMMLKRLLILSTRLYKEEHHAEQLEPSHYDIVREFNFLVEQHFKSLHTVSEYAGLLHKSPKTISNLFAKLGAKKPLQYIQERKMLEARRLLGYTDTSVKEIAYELGFEDIQAFSRFFKKNEGVSPSQFKETTDAGKIANS